MLITQVVSDDLPLSAKPLVKHIKVARLHLVPRQQTSLVFDHLSSGGNTIRSLYKHMSTLVDV